MNGSADEARNTENIREILAEVAHISWAGWTNYFLAKSEPEVVNNVKTGRMIVPAWAVERWTRQIETPYSALSETEKQSDREEADKTIAALKLAKLPPHVSIIVSAMVEAYADNKRGEYYLTLTPEKLFSMLKQNIAEIGLALEFDNDVRGKCGDVANYAGFIIRVYELSQTSGATVLAAE